MYIKESPVEGVKRECAGFQLDTSKVTLRSADKRKILLPYSGVLPEKLQNSDGAFISVVIRVGLTINVCLVIRNGKKDTRYLLEATNQEINDLLFNLLFVEKNSNRFNTAWGCGLTHYWLGHYQSTYTNWRRFVVEGIGVDDLIRQLPSKQLVFLARYIDELRKTA